jgi:hypothetical protein
MFAADGRGPGAVGVRAEHRRDGARRGGLAALVLGMRWQLRTKAVAALSGPATLVLAGAAAIGDAGLGQDSSFPGILLVSIELAAVVALVAISAWQQRFTVAASCAWWCYGVRRPLVSATWSLSTRS